MNGASRSTAVDFDLTCWYLNKRRIVELVGVEALSTRLQAINALSGNELLRSNAEEAVFKDALNRWLRYQKPQTLGQILVAREPRSGLIFTHYSNWFCRGLPEVSRAINRGKKPIPPAIAHTKLDDLREGWRIECRFHHDHLTSASSWSELSGQKNLLVVGLTTDVTNATIEAIPYVIANPVPAFDRPQTPVGKHWYMKLECHVDTIDSFAAVREVVSPLRAERDLEPLREISEEAVKPKLP